MTVGFRRGACGRRTAERRGPGAAAADRLLVPGERELVAAARLPRDARGVVLPRPIVVRGPAEIRHVGPGVRDAGVLVVEHVQDVLARTLGAHTHVVPEPVFHDWTATGHVDVV